MEYLQNNKRKNVLFLSSRLPYPPIGGDKLKNYWLLKILSKHFKVHLVSIAEEDIPKEFYSWAEEIGITYKVFRKNKREFYLNTLKGFFNKLPLQVNYYYFKDVQEYIDSIYKDFDLLFAILIRTARYVMDRDKPKILEMTDSIGQNYLKSKDKTVSLKWKLIYSIETNRLLNYEKLCIMKFAKTLLVNKNEADFFNQPEKVIWLPNGVNEDLLNYSKIDESWNNSIAFFGKMDYQPNIDAVLWFIKNVLSYLDKNLHFVIVGAYPPESLKKLEESYPNLKVLGYVEDPYVILKSSLCVVAPMQTGGGIQNKILESMALGTINIISSLAAKPIGGESGKHFLVADKPTDYVKLIKEIRQNLDKFEYIKTDAREFIRKNFTWSIYEEKLLSIIECFVSMKARQV